MHPLNRETNISRAFLLEGAFKMYSRVKMKLGFLIVYLSVDFD